MAKWNINIPRTQETIAKIKATCKARGVGKWMKNRKLSKSWKMNISVGNTGKVRTNEHKKKYSFSKLGEKNPMWIKSGRKVTYDGYVIVRCKNHPFANQKGWIREHRLIVENAIGRHLKEVEEVHHLGKKDDNRIHKLILFKNMNAHMRFEWGGDSNLKPGDVIFDGRTISKRMLRI
jgi:hypothetical protein